MRVDEPVWTFVTLAVELDERTDVVNLDVVLDEGTLVRDAELRDCDTTVEVTGSVGLAQVNWRLLISYAANWEYVDQTKPVMAFKLALGNDDKAIVTGCVVPVIPVTCTHWLW